VIDNVNAEEAFKKGKPYIAILMDLIAFGSEGGLKVKLVSLILYRLV